MSRRRVFGATFVLLLLTSMGLFGCGGDGPTRVASVQGPPFREWREPLYDKYGTIIGVWPDHLPVLRLWLDAGGAVNLVGCDFRVYCPTKPTPFVPYNPVAHDGKVNFLGHGWSRTFPPLDGEVLEGRWAWDELDNEVGVREGGFALTFDRADSTLRGEAWVVVWTPCNSVQTGPDTVRVPILLVPDGHRQ